MTDTDRLGVPASPASQPRLYAIVLGSAAGGGVPQWNCGCRVCRLAWSGDGEVMPRTQSSVAVSADGKRWLLLNASPDIRAQILATSALHPRSNRHSPIEVVLVTNGDVDHVAGLLTLRERQKLSLIGTSQTLATLAENPIFSVLADDCVERCSVKLNKPFEPLPGLTVEVFPVPGKVALWRESGESPVNTRLLGENTVGVSVSVAGARLVYIPGCSDVSDDIKARVVGADALLFDGTLFTDDEMIEAGLGEKTGSRMGHIAMSGPNGSMAALVDIHLGRRIFVHINNTNPALIKTSDERRAVLAAGWEIAYDGLEIKV